jgi:hypothetical protein
MSKPLPKIEKCPFPPCKGKGVSAPSIIGGFLVRCPRCCARGPIRDYERAAIAAWNRAQRDE